MRIVCIVLFCFEIVVNCDECELSSIKYQRVYVCD